tara:strand:- start:39 stop:1817 length:1779 start_codon:yes stop_codon:yes gene_type:complete
LEQIDTDYKSIERAWQDLKQDQAGKAKMLDDLWEVSYLGERVNILCDLALRHESFWLAVHYWELKWLEQRDDKYIKNMRGGSKSRKKFFQVLSHLTPLFVSTFHSAPGFCACIDKDPSGNSYHKEYLNGYFDLIVVDEGGQISPEVAIPTFSLAQKALVVGDVKQIEPVWRITSSQIDKSNLKHAGLIKDQDEYKKIERSGLTCFSGSILKIAQNRSQFHYPASSEEKGTMLQEHRRCVDEIIQYSNKEIYKGLLIPKIGSIEDIKATRQKKGKAFLDMPALGYLNVPGESMIKFGSRQNLNEAMAVASWIKHHKDTLETVYQTTIDNIVGVVTPFRSQKNLINTHLKKLEVVSETSQSLTVGTVHALQGAERPVVLFSPVYGTNDTGSGFFFDVNFNMLNVALSRAKEHFFVFGTLKNFDSWSSTPSGLLGKYLFAKQTNELEGGFLYDSLDKDTTRGILHKQPGIEVKRINTLDLHNRSLKAAISDRSKERVIIVSPFISINAIEAGGLANCFERGIKKQVNIIVYTDAFLDRKDGKLSDKAKKGRQLLENLGVEVIEKKGVHNKSLAIDDRVLLEGSFNWLSAVRDKMS